MCKLYENIEAGDAAKGDVRGKTSERESRFCCPGMRKNARMLELLHSSMEEIEKKLDRYYAGIFPLGNYRNIERLVAINGWNERYYRYLVEAVSGRIVPEDVSMETDIRCGAEEAMRIPTLPIKVKLIAALLTAQDEVDGATF